MPAYSYKERFVPMVKEGSKPHTIRARRKYPAKPGDTLYHYFGMRTRHCIKIAEDKCKDVKTIVITEGGIIVIFDHRLNNTDAMRLRKIPFGGKVLHKHKFNVLSRTEKNQLAWLDGFRPEGSSLNNPVGSFDLMFRWWKQTHKHFPFIGDIIYRDIKQLATGSGKQICQ